MQWCPAWSEQEGADRARGLFATAYDGRPDGIWSAPGRINLIGEHVDYCAGLCLPMALPHATYVALRRRDDEVVRLATDLDDGRWEGTTGDLRPGGVTGWAAYAGGPAWALGQADTAGPAVASTPRGFDAAIVSCVPLGAGLSSSASVECAVAMALDTAYGLGLAGDDAGRARLSAACVRAENEVAGAPTGGMDQAASLRATAGHALLLDCADFAVEQVPLAVIDDGLALLVIDTRAPHALVDGQYGERRATCEAAAATLGVPSLRVLADQIHDQVPDGPAHDAGVGDPAAHAHALAQALAALPDDRARRRVRHVVTEIARVRRASPLLRARDWPALGREFDASHASLRDDYEVSCPELDTAVTAARGAGALGARMTGGGFGGSAIALVAAGAAEAVAAAVAEAFAAAGHAPPAFLVATPGPGARRLA